MQIFSTDSECISTLLTFERLVLLCQNAISTAKRSCDVLGPANSKLLGTAPGGVSVVAGFDGDFRSVFMSCWYIQRWSLICCLRLSIAPSILCIVNTHPIIHNLQLISLRSLNLYLFALKKYLYYLINYDFCMLYVVTAAVENS